MAGNKNSGRGQVVGAITKKTVRRVAVRAGLIKSAVRDWMKEKEAVEKLLDECKRSMDEFQSNNDGKCISADNAAKWASAFEKLINTLKLLYGEIVPVSAGGQVNIHPQIVMFINKIEGSAKEKDGIQDRQT